MADATLDHFIAKFVLPLLAGGQVSVEGLLGPGVIAEWAKQGRPEMGLWAKLSQAMRQQLAHDGAVGEMGEIPLDALGLAAVWHNLIAVTHPEARNKKALRVRVKQWSEAMLGWVDVPRTRAEVGLRHAMLGRLGALGRVDTHVEFWAGYADFVGVAPPDSLLAWPNVRRVKSSRTRLDLVELLRGLDRGVLEDPEGDLRGVVRAALAASPLTDLTLIDRAAPLGFVWSPGALNAMGDVALRGAAVRILLGRGASAIRALEQATLALCREGTTERVAQTLLRLHLELVLSDAMAARLGSHGAAAGSANATVTVTAYPQPLAMDLVARLGAQKIAALVGLSPDEVQRTIPPDPTRQNPRDPPSAPLLAAANMTENRA